MPIKDVNVDILVGTVRVSSVGFSVPLLIGNSIQHQTLTLDNGLTVTTNSKTVDTQSISFIVSGNVISYAYSTNDLAITIPEGTTVAALVTDFTTNADAAIRAAFTLSGTSANEIVATPATDLQTLGYQEIQDVSQLRPYYETSDTEYQMINNMFAQASSVRSVIHVNLRAELADTTLLPDALDAINDGSWIAVLTSSTDSDHIDSIADWIEGKQRIGIFTGTFTNFNAFQASPKTASFMIPHTSVDDHVEAAIASVGLSRTVGSSTWKFIQSLVGQEPATFTITQLINIRNSNGQAYVRDRGINYVNEGKLSNGTFIDSYRSRLFVAIGLEDAIRNLFLSRAALNQKIPFDASGQAMIAQLMSERMDFFGDQGIIAVIETAEQAEASTSNKYQLTINVPPPSAVSIADKSVRIWSDVTFSYVEAGAVHGANITGRIVEDIEV